ncbi:hypothetical protein CLV72_101166 [Allonocardiopsis opalescens]|uniref:Uncharacterized protein n=2 Tax=Allonocardiopsis opalescens TaxID=1144618 RepID=A0A2T0QCK4_9ACTN|nr:hypothetical protein CLV72_101166 [Allonocardiopsis opalescens]
MELADWTGRWVAQLAAPSAVAIGAGTDRVVLRDTATGSLAYTTPDDHGGHTVTQRGPLRLWDQVEGAIETWHAHGSPHQSAFGLTVTPAEERVWLGSPDSPGWPLPV